MSRPWQLPTVVALAAVASLMLAGPLPSASTAPEAAPAAATTTTALPSTVYRFPAEIVELVVMQGVVLDDWVTRAEIRCWTEIAPLQRLALEWGIPLACVTGGSGGLYTGVAKVYASETKALGWHLDAAAHELGHGWDMTRLTDFGRDHVTEVLGWPTFDPESFADVVASAIGCWRDQGAGWRQLYQPTPEAIETLRSEGLLPANTDACRF